MIKLSNLITLALILVGGLMFATTTKAQIYQTKTDTAWCGWCYKFQNGNYYSKHDNKSVMTQLTTPTTGLSLVYYLRIPSTGAYADFVYTPKYARMPKITLTVTRASTGDTLYVGQTQNTTLALTGKEITVEKFLPHTIFPADEYYRFELNCDNWSYINNVKYFLFRRTSELPILQHPQGGYGQHLFNWNTTIPEAPVGQAYDWAYQEVLVPREYQHPADYYCTIATLSCYMGIQSVDRVGNNFNRTVLFSCWDSGNTDENPDLPQYLRAKVYDYNHRGVSGHGGGEGSSGTIQLNNDTTWWRSDEWVQFLVNARPENATEIEKNKNGEYEEHKVENTLLSVWYKMASDSAWTYLATIREANKNELMGSWYSFIENFGGGEGHQLHKVFYRHGYMRSAASGKWYNRNHVGFSHYGDRTTRTDRYSGTTSLYENAFQMCYGGWGLPTDSSNVAGLPKTDIAVDTINLDPLNERIDRAAHLWRHYSLNEEFNKLSPEHSHSNWTVVSCTGSNGAGALNESKSSSWESTSASGHDLVLKSKTGIVPINSIRVHHTEGRTVRVRYVNAYTSTDGENWTLQAENVQINNEDDNEITFPTTMRSEYFKFHFHTQLDPRTSPRLKFSTLAFRGDYDLDRVKALTKDIIAHENCLEYYKTDDIAHLKEIYGDGTNADLDALTTEIRHIYKDCFPLMYGRVAATSHITATKAYMMQQIGDHGFICANQQGLAVKGATAANAKEATRANAAATDSMNTWQIIRSEKFESVYIYNIGTHKYLNPEGEGWLSTTPYPFTAGLSGKGCAFRSAKENAPEYNKNLCLNSSQDAPFYWGTLNDNARFLLLDDYYLRPDNLKAMEVINNSYINDRLNACKQRYEDLLTVPEGRIGSIPADTKAKINTLYNEGNPLPQNVNEFIEAVENIQLLELEYDHVYRITSATETTTGSLAITANGLSTLSNTLSKPGQIWRVYKKGDGAIIESQGRSLGIMPTNTGGTPKAGSISTPTPDKAVMYYLTEKAPGTFQIADHSYPTYAVGISNATVSAINANQDNALWNIDVANEFSVRTNSVGYTSLYVDFDLIIPEGREVFVANHVTPDGVVKLSQLTDIIPANTGVLIKGDPNETVTFEIGTQGAAPYPNRNCFDGSLFKNTNLKKNEYYTLMTNNKAPVMKRAAISSMAADNEIYIVKTSTLPDLQYYTFDFDDIIDSVSPATAIGHASSTYYDLQGNPTLATQHGIYITDQKVVKK